MRVGLSVECLILAGLSAFGQVSAGTISGSVCNAAGLPISGAAVEAKNADTGVIYSAVSASTGNYTVAPLPAGKYAISVKMQGMKPYAHSYLSVDPDAVIREDVALEIDESPAYAFPYNPPPARVAIRPPGRDFYAEDAELGIAPTRLAVNDSGVELPHDLAAKGKIVWVYLPGHGRYLLSVLPHSDAGFSLAGEVGGTSIHFQLRDDDVQIDTRERIVAGSATYNLYVLHQAGWAPRLEAERSAVSMGSLTDGELTAK